VRRITFILASVAAFFGATAVAGAHPLVTSFQLPVGRAATVALQVPSENPDSPMAAVDVELPSSYELDRVVAGSGWAATTTGRTVHIAGAPLPIGATLNFTMRGTFRTRGLVEIPVTTVAADGTAKRWTGPLAAKAYAGVTAPGTTGGSGMGATTIAGVVLVGGGAVAAVVLVLRRRRVAVQ
jgi:hypothetical protein